MMERSLFQPIIDNALAEDLDVRGDVTSAATVPDSAMAVADVVAREHGTVAGIPVAAAVFETVDAGTRFEALLADGDPVQRGDRISTVSGPARSILTAERTALNLLGRMSGVATATARYVAAVEGTGARISDTRKTMPGLRVLDKYSVVVGGGVNHRMGLHDAVMIKDNHLLAGMEIEDAVAAVRAVVGPSIEVTVEVENLEQLRRVLGTDADRVLLDNMDIPSLIEAVALVDGSMITEASGSVNLDTVRGIAETGVDVISVGSITHSAPQLDIALDFRSAG